MLNVIKFFKRTEDAGIVSSQEFEALREGLVLYGVNQEELISEMKYHLLQGNKIDHYKTVVKKQILSNLTDKHPAMIKLIKECDASGQIPEDMDKYLTIQIQNYKTLSELSENFKSHCYDLTMPLEKKNHLIKLKNEYQYESMKEFLQKQDLEEPQIDKILKLA